MAKNEETELVREPEKFQPGKLGDLLYILQISTIRLLEMGSNHVRSGVTNQVEVETMALDLRDALGMWLGLVPCKDFRQILQQIGQDQILEHLRWCGRCRESCINSEPTKE